MLNDFSGVGNVGVAPALHRLDVDGEKRMVAHCRVYFDRPVRQKDGQYLDKGGFWLSVSLWDKRAEQALQFLHKGTRVLMRGTLRGHTWTDKTTGESRSELQLTAAYFYIDPIGIESIQYQTRHRPVSELMQDDPSLSDPDTFDVNGRYDDVDDRYEDSV